MAGSLDQIDAAAWDRVLAASPAATPFLRHAYLQALEASGSATADTGWQPLHLLLHEVDLPDEFDEADEADVAGASAAPRGRLAAALPLYLKSHSYGEYVFDWSWADAWQLAGGNYYPKLLAAVPFTPVPGSRLLAVDDLARQALLQGLEDLARQQGWSSAHVLFVDEADRAAATARGWLLRRGVQFHWHNRQVDQPGAPPYADWADYLASLTRDKRKKMQQERGYVARAGVSFEVRRGTDIGEADWDHFYRCYTRTYAEHHSTPYLTRDFFRLTALALPGLWTLVLAWRKGERVAASLLAVDDPSRTVYGRYWGTLEDIPHLHFAACYHEPLDWCIRQGMRRFEGGAQGEHKMARGLLPQPTWSAHWLADAGFSAAVERFLERERAGIADYMEELGQRSPYRRGESPG